MALAVRRTWLIIVLALGLLVGLLGWTMHMEATPVHAAGLQRIHLVTSGPNYYCPPPPYDCWGG